MELLKFYLVGHSAKEVSWIFSIDVYKVNTSIKILKLWGFFPFFLGGRSGLRMKFLSSTRMTINFPMTAAMSWAQCQITPKKGQQNHLELPPKAAAKPISKQQESPFPLSVWSTSASTENKREIATQIPFMAGWCFDAHPAITSAYKNTTTSACRRVYVSDFQHCTSLQDKLTAICLDFSRVNY